MPQTAFLSYSSLDSEKVDDLERLLREAGIDVRRDVYDLRVGDDLEARIRHFIEKRSDYVVVALTNNALASPWVKKETEWSHHAASLGWPVSTLYVKVDGDTYVPDEIKRKLVIDLTIPTGRRRDSEMLKLARAVTGNPFRRHGLYNIYTSNEDMDARRETAAGDHGCSLSEFLGAAENHIVGVALWFGALFGNDKGSILADLLRQKPNLRVDLYVPDPTRAPRNQLTYIHHNPGGVWSDVDAFVTRFNTWGRERNLSRAETSRLTLHLLPFVPTASILAVDPEHPTGRMIIDLYAPSVKPSEQVKLELRSPATPAYTRYLSSLHRLASGEIHMRNLVPEADA